MPRAKKKKDDSDIVPATDDGQEPKANFQRNAEDPDELIEDGAPALFEGINKKIPRKLKTLAESVKLKRDTMISAKNSYVADRDLLIESMQRAEITEFELATGETVKLTDSINVKIAKPKKQVIDLSELDEDDE